MSEVEIGHPSNEILHRGERAAVLTLSHDRFGQRRTESPHRGQPEAHHRPVLLEGRPGQRGVQVRGAHLDPVATGVAHQGVRRPEPHRLSVDERRAERRRLVVFDPR